MKFYYYNNTATLVEHKNTKILFDPWMVGTAYYGSWGIFPEPKIDWDFFKDVNYIHISHIHPDHLHEETLRRLPDSIPILIHNWDFKFVARSLKRMGKTIIELEHGEPFHVGDGMDLRVFAADGCNPEACCKFFGCGKISNPAKSVGIDTFSLLSGDRTILQINDCPFDLARTTLENLKEEIDLLCVGYTGASSYPQCFENYSEEDIQTIYAPRKRQLALDMGLSYLNMIKPKKYLPYAGTYVLIGKNYELENLKGGISLDEALEFYQSHGHKNGFLLSQGGKYDLRTGVSDPYESIDEEEKRVFQQTHSNALYDYENDLQPDMDELRAILPKAFNRYCLKRQEMSYSSDFSVYIKLDSGYYKIYNDRDKAEFVDEVGEENRVVYSMDLKLLFRLIKGPQFAHFNNAEIGSHIKFFRCPDIYERKLYYLMNYFHA